MLIIHMAHNSPADLGEGEKAAMKKRAYRFQDLLPGDRFYIETYPYDVLTVASITTGGNAWIGERKIYLHPNTRVDPVDRRKAAQNRISAVRAACRANNITPQDLRKHYATALLNHREPTSDLRIKLNAGIVRDLPQEVYFALDDLNLIQFAQLSDRSDYLPYIAGRYFSPFL